MSAPAKLRVADRLKQIDFEANGFRARHGAQTRFIPCLILGLVLGIICANIVLEYNMLAVFNLFLAGAIFIVIANIYVQRMKLVQQATEFMNAILSSVVGQGYRFCTVVRNDGYIIYLNRGFQAMFPKFIAAGKFDLPIWGEMQGLAEADRKQIMQLIESKTAKTFVVRMTMGEATTPENVTLTVAPVDKPEGYTIIRGQ